MATIVADGGTLSANVREQWDSGSVVDFVLTADVPLGNWRVVVDAGGTIVNIWNAAVLSQSGTRYVLQAETYNQNIQPGRSVEFGVEIEGSGEVLVDAIQLDLSADLAAQTAAQPPAPPVPDAAPADQGEPAPAPAVAPTAAPLGGSAERMSARDVHLFEPSALPGASDPAITISPATVAEPPGSGAGLPGHTGPLGPLYTSGSQIVDSAGAPVTLRGLNWFGLETDIFVPHGLWARNWREMMDEMKSLGFNAIRIPFSGELVSSGGGTPSGIDTGLNPDLAGLNGLEILDAIVDYAGTIGLNIVLDYHRGAPGGGPNENGLWFGNGRSEADVIAEWQTMASRYANKPAVIGADLINEPFQATWGDGSATDWAAAAERIGGAVQQIAPHWLILVEGVSVYDGDPYWWGGNLQGVADHPVDLPISGKLVYSPHDYPASVHPQDWFFDGTNLIDKFRENWGYIVEEGIAPVMIGEWGSRLNTADDLRWADALSRYMDQLDMSWLWWSLNPNSGDTGGIYEDDWTTVRAPVMDLLAPQLEDTRPVISLTETAEIDALATFDITVDNPADKDLTLKYATTDGTAKAGEDYVATAGTITLPAGATAASVTVPVLPDMSLEGDQFFYLVLSQGGSVRASSTAVIEDTATGSGADAAGRRLPSAPAALPLVDVASTVVAENAGAARFRIILSEPTDRDVAIDYATSAETASGADFDETRGTVIIPAGERDAILEVSVDNDALPEDAERFSLELTAADGADIRTREARALIPAEPAAAAEVAVTRSATDATQATIDIILENDWGTGALFNVAIKNDSPAPISRWELSLDLPFDLAELWSAVLVEDAGERVTVQNAEWNGEISPGETVNFGFIADMGDISLGPLLSGADIELAVQ